MHIEQIYTGCLAEAAYYIESDGEAVVIDPLRETEPYLELAQKRNAKIKGPIGFVLSCLPASVSGKLQILSRKNR